MQSQPEPTESKYHPLYLFLKQSEQDELTLTLTAIETLLNASLPDSAHTKRAWWSNRSSGALQANAWMQAGYHVVTIELDKEQITFRKPGIIYNVQREGDIVLWNADLVKALRHHMGLSQAEFARELGVRQPTISEWETGAYTPKRSTSKLLTLIAEQAGFTYS
ncbi:MAG: helix-turn-helix domain-containing protein [Chloroflexota bacterium]